MTIIQLGSGLAERAGPWTGGGVEGGEGRGVREVYCLYIYALFSLVDWAQSTSQLTNLVLTAKKKKCPSLQYLYVHCGFAKRARNCGLSL